MCKEVGNRRADSSQVYCGYQDALARTARLRRDASRWRVEDWPWYQPDTNDEPKRSGMNSGAYPKWMVVIRVELHDPSAWQLVGIVRHVGGLRQSAERRALYLQVLYK